MSLYPLLRSLQVGTLRAPVLGMLRGPESQGTG